MSPIFVPKQASVYMHSGYSNVMPYHPVIFRRFVAALFVLFLNTRARYGTLPYRFHSATKLNISKTSADKIILHVISEEPEYVKVAHTYRKKRIVVHAFLQKEST